MSTLTEPQEQAFDASVYDLPIPNVDTLKADRLALNFSGSVELDRTSSDDLELINRLEGLQLGQSHDLRVTVTVTRKGFTYSMGKDGEPGEAGYGVGLKVHTLEVA